MPKQGDKACGCQIVGEKLLVNLMKKYLGLMPGDLTSDEREILLFALYMESNERGGLASKPTAEDDARVAEAKAKLDAIIASEEGRDAE